MNPTLATDPPPQSEHPPELQDWPRNSLVRVTDSGWTGCLAGRPAGAARDCLEHWAAHDLPLVVTRQRGATASGPRTTLALGLPAPSRWQRLRLSLVVALEDLRAAEGFPHAHDIAANLDSDLRPAWTRLCDDLVAAGSSPRVYGSHGWQALTGLDHVREGSDIDLLLSARSAAAADALVRHLVQWEDRAARLDGEIIFPQGHAVAWREWAAWRDGRSAQILVKHREGIALHDSLAGWADAC